MAFIISTGRGRDAGRGVCREAGISQATEYAWRKMSIGMMPPEMKWTRLKNKNGRLKRIVADLLFDRAMLQGVIELTRRGPATHRRAEVA